MPQPAPDALLVRVYYEDTDFSSRVYHASYLRFFERGRTEWLRGRGMAHREMAEGSGLVFAVRSLKIDYLAPRSWTISCASRPLSPPCAGRQ